MRKELLTVDGVINLVLGVFLLWYPAPLVRAIGLPSADSRFFGSVLGAVLFGIGLALLIERLSPLQGIGGLRLGGAIAINLCGGCVLADWLLTGTLPITSVGQSALWGLVTLLFGISGLELYSALRHSPR